MHQFIQCQCTVVGHIAATSKAAALLLNTLLAVSPVVVKMGESNVSSRWTAPPVLQAVPAVHIVRAVAEPAKHHRPTAAGDKIWWRHHHPLNASVKEYTLYRAAKGIYHGRLGAAADELADEELVGDDTLLMILNSGRCGAGRQRGSVRRGGPAVPPGASVPSVPRAAPAPVPVFPTSPSQPPDAP